MKLRILPKTQEMVIEYRAVEQCPLCGTPGEHESALARKAYRFSKDLRYHEAVTYLTMYAYDFCGPARTLRAKDDRGR